MNSEFTTNENERASDTATARDIRRLGAVHSALTTHDSLFIRRRKAAAFTLIEMLVVIALIGVLASMLTVVIIFARRLSIQLECRGHLSEIGKTLNQMALNAGGVYPDLVDDDGIPWWANVFEEWAGSSSARIDTDPSTIGLQLPVQLPAQMRIFHCRMAGALNNSPEEANMLIRAANLANSISYGLNFDVMDSDTKHYHASNTVDPYSPRFPATLTVNDKYPDEFYYTQIATPATFILVSEADTQDPDPVNWTGSRISMGAITRDAADLPPNDAPIVGRHGGWANVLFADLHVEAMEVGGGHWTKDVNTNTALWTLPDD